MNLTEADNNRIFMSEELENRLTSDEAVSRMQMVVTNGDNLWAYDVEHVAKKRDGKYEITCLGDKPNQRLFEIEQAVIILSIDDEILVNSNLEIVELTIEHRYTWKEVTEWKLCFKLGPINNDTGA